MANFLREPIRNRLPWVGRLVPGFTAYVKHVLHALLGLPRIETECSCPKVLLAYYYKSKRDAIRALT